MLYLRFEDTELIVNFSKLLLQFQILLFKLLPVFALLQKVFLVDFGLKNRKETNKYKYEDSNGEFGQTH